MYRARRAGARCNSRDELFHQRDIPAARAAVPLPDRGDEAALAEAADDSAGRRRRARRRLRDLPFRRVAGVGAHRADQLAGDRHGQPALPGLPDHRRDPRDAFRALLGARRHLRRGDARTLCDEQKGLPHQAAQLLYVGGGQRDDYRFRRFGRPRGADRADRFGHRLEHRPVHAAQLPGHHAAALLRCGGRPFGRVQRRRSRASSSCSKS